MKAWAEMTIGSTIAGLGMSWAFDGNISGGGDPDPNKRRVQMASGWQPYSIKVGDKWYSYNRIQPLGTLLGMAADVADAIPKLPDLSAAPITVKFESADAIFSSTLKTVSPLNFPSSCAAAARTLASGSAHAPMMASRALSPLATPREATAYVRTP